MSASERNGIGSGQDRFRCFVFASVTVLFVGLAVNSLASGPHPEG